MSELKKESCIQQDGNYMRRYIVTDSAISAIDIFRAEIFIDKYP